MTTSAVLLPRREQALPAPGVDGLSNRLVTNGVTAAGLPAGPIFYWSHTRFYDGFGFGLHPHQGFEIVTVIIDGTTEHYDTAHERWLDLAAGDVQIIRSGAGIRHAERAHAGARVFQIWIDPGFDAALQRPATYDDHAVGTLPRHRVDGGEITSIIGGDGPVGTHTPGLTMQRVAVEPRATVELAVEGDALAIAYVIEGTATIDGTAVGTDDSAVVEGIGPIRIEAGGSERADVFVLSAPSSPDYRLVSDQRSP